MPSIEDHIQKAMEEGKFDNLPGQGKPLRLDDDPNEDPEWWAANHLLKNSGFTPSWLADRKEIEADLAKARLELARSWRWYQEQAANRSASGLEAEWQRAAGRFQEQVARLNRRIFNYNLIAPNVQFHLMTIKTEQEIQSITGVRP